MTTSTSASPSTDRHTGGEQVATWAIDAAATMCVHVPRTLPLDEALAIVQDLQTVDIDRALRRADRDGRTVTVTLTELSADRIVNVPYALDEAGNVLPVEFTEPDPAAHLRALVEAWRSASDSGDGDAEHTAALELADAVEATADIIASAAVTR